MAVRRSGGTGGRKRKNTGGTNQNDPARSRRTAATTVASRQANAGSSTTANSRSGNSEENGGINGGQREAVFRQHDSNEGASLLVTNSETVMDAEMGDEDEQLEERRIMDSRRSSFQQQGELTTIERTTGSTESETGSTIGHESPHVREVPPRLGNMLPPPPGRNNSGTPMVARVYGHSEVSRGNNSTFSSPTLQGRVIVQEQPVLGAVAGTESSTGHSGEANSSASCDVSEVTTNTEVSSNRSGGMFSYPLSRTVRESIKRVVKQRVFPGIKVISGEFDLQKGQFAERTVWREWVLAQPKEKRGEMTEAVRATFWTEEVKDIVRRELNNKRNNVSGVVRNKFLGEWTNALTGLLLVEDDK